MLHQVRVLTESPSDHLPGVRRPVLIHRATGLLHELGTAFIYRQYPHKPFRTQIAALHDASFFFEWCELKRQRLKSKWISPESRLAAGKAPLSLREITDFGRWCAITAARMATESQRSEDEVRKLPFGDPVECATSNRRLRTTLSYLLWLTAELYEEHRECRHVGLDAVMEICASLRKSFHDQEYTEVGKMPVSSLDERSHAALLAAIGAAPAVTTHDRRDVLILRTLCETGMRAGELLKLQCSDVSDVYAAEPSRAVGCIEVHLRPNDRFDDRRVEPAGKTLPRPILVSRKLARDVISYMTGDRQSAVDECGWEHPYLFVCHSGTRLGRPISQRNLNRIVATFSERAGLQGILRPHVLRHTHFDRLHEKAESEGIDPREILLQRGGWTGSSGMPQRYTQRSIIKQTARFVTMREDAINAKRAKKD